MKLLAIAEKQKYTIIRKQCSEHVQNEREEKKPVKAPLTLKVSSLNLGSVVGFFFLNANLQ